MIYKSLGMPKYPIIYKKFENELNPPCQGDDLPSELPAQKICILYNI